MSAQEKKEEIQEKKWHQKAIDEVFRILSTGTAISATAIDLLDGKLVVDNWRDNSFSEMIADHRKKNNQEMTGWDYATGFILDVGLDPSTYFTGGATKVGQIDDALKIAKGVGGLSADVLKVTDTQTAKKLFEESKKLIDTKTKQGQEAFLKINKAERYLEGKKGAKRLNTALKNQEKHLLTAENIGDTSLKSKIKEALVSDDVKLYTDHNTLKTQQQKINKIIKADYTEEIAEETKKLDKISKEVQEEFDELLKKDITDIVEDTEKRKQFKQYQRSTKKINELQAQTKIDNYPIKAMESFFGAGSVNELLHADSAVNQLIDLNYSKSKKGFQEIAKKNKLDYNEWSEEVFDFIETGNKGKLNEDSLKAVDIIKKEFDNLRKIEEAALNKPISKIKDNKYIPRILDTDNQEAQQKFYVLMRDAGKERTTKDLTFKELQNKLAEEGSSLLKTDPAELLARAEKKTAEQIKLAVLEKGINPYKSKFIKKGYEQAKHSVFKGKDAVTVTPKEFRNRIKGKLSKELFEELDGKDVETMINIIEKSSPDAVKDVKKLTTKFKKRDTYLPTQVAEKINPIVYRNSTADTLGQRILDSYQGYNNAWKKNQLAYSGQYHANNFIDSKNRLFIHEPSAFNKIKKASDLQAGKKISINTPSGKKEFSLEDFIQNGITGGKYNTDDFKQSKNQVSKLYGLLSGNNKLADGLFKIGNLLEDNDRIALALSQLEKGLDWKNTADKVKEVFYASSELPEFVKNFSKNAYVFGNFTFENLSKLPKHIKAGGGRNLIPIKLANTSKVDQQEFSVEDKLADGNTMMNIGRGKSLSLEPKFAQLEALSMLDSVLGTENMGEGFGTKLLGYTPPIMGMLESIINFNFKTRKNIKTPDKETKNFIGFDMDPRIKHFIDTQARPLKLLNDVLEDEDNNFLYDTFVQEGSEKGFENLKKNIGYYFLGTPFNRNIEMSANMTLRKLGEEASILERQINELSKEWRSGNKNPTIKSEYDKKTARAEDLRRKQNILRKELPKIKKYQEQMTEETAKKMQIKIPKFGEFNFLKELLDHNQQQLRNKTQVEVLEVIDGDTIQVKMPNGSIEFVRLGGIDSPEKEVGTQRANLFSRLTEEDNKYLYNHAKEQLINLLRDKEVNIQRVSKYRDPYDRPIVQVTIPSYESGEIDINSYLLKNGIVKPAFINNIENEDYRNKMYESSKYAEDEKRGFYQYLLEETPKENIWDSQEQKEEMYHSWENIWE